MYTVFIFAGQVLTHMLHFRLNCIVVLLLAFFVESGAQNQSDALKGTFFHEGNIPSAFLPRQAWLKWPADTQMVAAIQKKILAEGQLLLRSGKHEEALYYYQSALNAPIFPARFRVNLYNIIANLHQDNGNYEEALKSYYNALKHADDEQGKAKILINISALHLDLKDLDKAMGNLDKAISVLTQSDGGIWTAIAFLNRGNVYSTRNVYDKALEEFHKAYRILEKIDAGKDLEPTQKIDINDMRAVIVNNIGDAYLKAGRADSALFYLRSMLPHFNDISRYSQCIISITLGEALSHQGNDQLALEYLRQGLAIGEQSGSQVPIKEAHRLLSLVEARLGHYKAAWEHQNTFVQLNDSLATIEHVNKINRLERQFDLSKRDKKLAQKELLITRQASRIRENSWQTAVLVTVVVLLVSMVFVFRKNYKNKQYLLKEQLNNAIKDKRIMQIEAGIKGEERERTRIARDLHDGVVSEMLAMKLNLEAMERDHYALKHSDEFRNIIFQAEEVTDRLRKAAHNLMPFDLQEQGLIDIVQAFISRIDNYKLQFSFLYYGAVPALNQATGKIILMITLELIQNILKHARATEALLQFNFFEDNFTITLEDNGIGIGNDYKTKKGMGIANIESNVAALNGLLDIKSSEYTGTTTLIEIPLDEHTLQNKMNLPNQDS